VESAVKTFGDFEFDEQRRRLSARGQPVRLNGQALDLLCLLLDRPGALITKLEARSAKAPRRWRRRLVTYAVVAILAALVALVFVRTRYDRFVPRDRSYFAAAGAGDVG
jgi:DNA-binding winged helix-turn-helix (wHTH) protein